jgi:CTD small phosphatase-like protein 2
MKDILIIDNLVHSFAFQLDNGIPILEFIANKKDRELYYMCDRLIDIAKSQDVRKEIKKMYNLTQILEHDESAFIWNGESRY